MTAEILWTALAAVAALASACIAAYYTRLTYRLVQGQSEPNVVMYVRHDESRAPLLQIVIENIGRGLASDLRFKSSRPIPKRTFGDGRPVEMMKKGPLIEGIPTLGPGDSRKIAWGEYRALNEALSGESIIVTCEYKQRDRRMPPVTAVLEIQSFTETDAVDSEGARVIRELKRIADALEVRQRMHGGRVESI